MEKYMLVKVQSNWGDVELISEEGDKYNFSDGAPAKIENNVGRLYKIYDKSSHVAGHGMGQMTSVQVVFVYGDNHLGIVRENMYVIELEMK
jgi:hypothetical protein